MRQTNKLNIDHESFSVDELHPKFLQIVCDTIENIGKSIFVKLIYTVIRKTQKYQDECLILPDDSTLENVWDEFCAQLQSDFAFGYDMQYDLIIELCTKALKELKQNQNNKYQILAIYLTACHHPDFNFEMDCLFGDSELVLIIMNKVSGFAGFYSNRKINHFIYL